MSYLFNYKTFLHYIFYFFITDFNKQFNRTQRTGYYKNKNFRRIQRRKINIHRKHTLKYSYNTGKKNHYNTSNSY